MENEHSGLSSTPKTTLIFHLPKFVSHEQVAWIGKRVPVEDRVGVLDAGLRYRSVYWYQCDSLGCHSSLFESFNIGLDRALSECIVYIVGTQ